MYQTWGMNRSVVSKDDKKGVSDLFSKVSEYDLM